MSGKEEVYDMKSAMKKTSLREIRHSLGRYLAIFSIVALGVIMFAGLNVCREDMVATADKYFSDTALYDFRALSTLGFDIDDVEALTQADGVKYAQGGKIRLCCKRLRMEENV